MKKADLEPRPKDRTRLFPFSAEKDLIGCASADPLVRALAVEPLRVARQIPVDGLEGAIDEESPGVLGLQGPPETLDPGWGRFPPDDRADPDGAEETAHAGEVDEDHVEGAFRLK